MSLGLPAPGRDACFAVLIAAAVFPLIFALSVLRGMNHDEHQHLAAGYLMATEGLWPYRDFPYFHPPVLPLIYAALLGVGDSLLAETRLFSAVCAALTVGLVAWLALRWAPADRSRVRAAFAAAAVGLLLGAPVFALTVGRTSNHDVSVLLAVAAIAMHLAALEGSGARWRWLISGLLLALAAGTRVTLAPLALPFLVAIWVVARDRRLPAFGWFAAGLLLGGLPMALSFAAAPGAFFYGVFGFSATNLDYRASTGNVQTMTLLPKLRFFFQPIVVTHVCLALALAGALALCAWGSRCRRINVPPRVWFLCALLPFALIGALAPSPSFQLYYYALVPLSVLAAVAAAAAAYPVAGRVARIVFGAIVGIGVLIAVPHYEKVREVFARNKWTPPDVHLDARELHAHLSPGARLLTLAPIRALEAGYRIYPAFATGPFAWRVAPFVPATKRRELDMIGPDDLERYLDATPPDGILTGREKLLEEPLIRYARRHGYAPVPIWNGREQLWLKPRPRGHRR